MALETGSSHSRGMAARNNTVRTLIRVGWRACFVSGVPHGPAPKYSGVIPLWDPLLNRFLKGPGIFVILGPLPELPVLFIGSAPGPMEKKFWEKLEPSDRGGFAWRWESESHPPPTYAACIAFSAHQEMIPVLSAFLAREIQGPATSNPWPGR